jgi:D-3-phosphoglycerate dehydrogenase / 2-oxoglutarate reductase
MNRSPVIVADCDHENIDIEREVLRDIADDLPWYSCKTEEEVIVRCSGARGLLIQYAPITKGVLSRLSKCEVIVRYGVGVDTVDLEAASALGVAVCNVPDYGTNEVSDHALALLLCLERKIVRANRLIREGVWDFREMKPVRRLQVQTVGVIGLGRIGRRFAEKVLGLGMKVIACDPFVPKGLLPSGVELTDLEDLLERSDAVSVHVPLNADTKGLLSADAISRMKVGAYLVNTARGSIVDEVALERALASGALGGAALDVAAREPLRPDDPLLSHDNFICTPHMAWHSAESEKDLKRKAAEEVRRVLTGAAPLYRVNRVAP